MLFCFFNGEVMAAVKKVCLLKVLHRDDHFHKIIQNRPAHERPFTTPLSSNIHAEVKNNNCSSLTHKEQFSLRLFDREDENERQLPEDSDSA